MRRGAGCITNSNATNIDERARAWLARVALQAGAARVARAQHVQHEAEGVCLRAVASIGGDLHQRAVR